MNQDLIEFLIIPVTIISLAIGIYRANQDADRNYGSEHRITVNGVIIDLLKVLAPIGLYSIAASYFGVWNTLILSTEFSMGALILFFMASYEVGIGFGIHHTQPINTRRLKPIVFSSLLGVSLTSISTVLIFKESGKIPYWVAGIPALLLVSAITLFLFSALMVRVVRIKHRAS